MTPQKQKNILNNIPRYFLLISVIIISAFFAVMQPKFLNINNLMDIVSTSSVVGVMAIGMTIVMATGEMNLAVGAEATIAAAVVARILYSPTVISYQIAVILGLLASLVVGLLNSFFVVKIGVPSFIATIAMTTFMNGFIKILTNNAFMYSKYWPSAFTFLGQTRIGGVVPMPAIIFTFLSFAAIIMMDKTKLGRYLNSVGSAPVACSNVGINAKKIVVSGFLVCSFITGLGGIISASMVKSVSPTLGSDILMSAMAATMLGGTFLRPGQYNVQGTIVASFLLTIIQNGATSIGAPNYFKDLIQGFTLIFAVGTIAVTRKEGLPSVTFYK